MAAATFNLAAFAAYLRGRVRTVEQMRAMGLQSEAAGGYLVPETWIGMLTVARASRFIRRHAAAVGRVIPVNRKMHGAAATTLPTMAKIARGVNGEHTATATTPVITGFRITDANAKGGMPLQTIGGGVVASKELEGDINDGEAIGDDDAIGAIGRMLTESLATEEARQFVVGTGPENNEAYGLSRLAVLNTRVVNSTLNQTVPVRDLMQMVKMLGDGRYESACWLASPEAIGAMAAEELVTSAGDPTPQAIVQVGSNAEGLTLLGRPLGISSHLDNPAGTNPHVILYDPYEYFIGERRGSVAVQRLDELYAATNQSGWMLHQRMTANILNPQGVVALVSGS